MKKLILASAITAATILSSIIPSQAASVVISTSDGYHPHHRVYDRAPMRRHCFTKTERFRNHGHVVVRQTRVCR